MEFIRAYMLTGFSMAELGHSQYRWSWLIQIADIGGSFAVSFVVMLGTACVARMLPMNDNEKDSASTSGFCRWPIIPVAAVLASVLAYGAWRTGQSSAEEQRSLRVALIQSSFDTEFRVIEGRDKKIMGTYKRLSLQAVQQSKEPIDLLVWPESMFRSPMVTAETDVAMPADWKESPESFWRALEAQQTEFLEQLTDIRLSANATGFLTGVGRAHYTKSGVQRFNSAVFAAETNIAPETYDKMHAVPFGEYIPLARYVPWVYDITPLQGGIEEGANPKLFRIGDTTFSPSICFESIQSHHIRDAVVQLRETVGDPDFLVNVTNDGWFWGSSELDLHLICGVFRAIEVRKPFLVAANTGISAVIDGNGNVLEQGPKRGNAVLVRDVAPDPRTSSYLDYGPWFGWLCLAVTALAAGVGLKDRFQRRS